MSRLSLRGAAKPADWGIRPSVGIRRICPWELRRVQQPRWEPADNRNPRRREISYGDMHRGCTAINGSPYGQSARAFSKQTWITSARQDMSPPGGVWCRTWYCSKLLQCVRWHRWLAVRPHEVRSDNMESSRGSPLISLIERGALCDGSLQDCVHNVLLSASRSIPSIGLESGENEETRRN